MPLKFTGVTFEATFCSSTNYDASCLFRDGKLSPPRVQKRVMQSTFSKTQCLRRDQIYRYTNANVQDPRLMLQGLLSVLYTTGYAPLSAKDS